MDVVDGHGTPVAVLVASASESEVNLIEPTLDQIQVPDRDPEFLLYDKAADSDPLRERLKSERGIQLVCPHRKGRKKKPTQDGRSLARYRKRFKVERTHSWYHNFRRLVVRYETTSNRFLGWIHIASTLITLRRF